MVRARNVNKTAESITNSDWEQEEFSSRTDIKRAAKVVTELGDKLVQTPENSLKKMQLPNTLYEAIMLEKKMSKGPALKRQRLFIGKYLRKNEILISKIKDFFKQQEIQFKRQQLHFKNLETINDNLINGDTDREINKLIDLFPNISIDRTRLRQLIRAAQKNKTTKEALKYLKENIVTL